MEVEDLSRNADYLADDILKRAAQRTIARFSFAFIIDKLNAAARALMNSGLRFLRVEETGTVLLVEVPLHRLTDAVATCLSHDGRYLRLVAMPS